MNSAAPVLSGENGHRSSRIRPGEIHLWLIDLRADAANLSSLTGLLSQDERNRAGQFRFGDDRRRFIVARGTLRAVLGEYLERDPASLVIELNSFGKPFLRSADRPLHFNVSHSGDRALLAVSPDAPLGVDFEDLQHESRLGDLSDSICAPSELTLIDALPFEKRSRALLRLWTAKEAFLKALGTGLQIDPVRLEISPGIATGSAEMGSVRWIDSPGVSSRYRLQPFPVCEGRWGGSAALAVEWSADVPRFNWMRATRRINGAVATA